MQTALGPQQQQSFVNAQQTRKSELTSSFSSSSSFSSLLFPCASVLHLYPCHGVPTLGGGAMDSTRSRRVPQRRRRQCRPQVCRWRSSAVTRTSRTQPPLGCASTGCRLLCGPDALVWPISFLSSSFFCFSFLRMKTSANEMREFAFASARFSAETRRRV